jgi:uncharacterized membrane protein
MEKKNNASQSQKQNKAEQKTFLGMPMNWDLKNWHSAMWNPDDDNLFPPKAFGIGWTINFHAVLKKAHLLKK